MGGDNRNILCRRVRLEVNAVQSEYRLEVNAVQSEYDG